MPKNPYASDCQGKQVFESKASALRILRLRAKRGRRDNLLPYRCPYCHQWHLGHRKLKD